MKEKIIITALILVIIAQYYLKKKSFATSDPDSQQEISEIVANLREEKKDLETQLQQAQQLEKFNTQQINRLQEQLATYQQDGDWESKTGEIIKNLEAEVKDLTTERDEAIREQKTSEQEIISLSNKLKLKNQETTNKDTEITRLKDEKSKVEIALNKTITELRTKYSKREKLLDEEQCENNKLTEEKEKLQAELANKVASYNESRKNDKKTRQEQEKKIQAFTTKITDLENQLLNLAKQKIKGKKEALELVKNWEIRLAEKESIWQTEKKELELKLTAVRKGSEAVSSVLRTNQKALAEETQKVKELTQQLEQQTKKNATENQALENTVSELIKGMQDLNKELDK